MARQRNGHAFTTIAVRGGILPAQFVSRVAALKASHQTGPDYGLSKSLNLKDEIARYWRIANDLFTAFQERRQRADLDKANVGVDEWLVPLLRDVFGFKDLAPASAIELGERLFPITHEVFAGAVPLVLTTADMDLDRADVRFGDNGRRRAAHNLMQELLNSSDSHAWGIISNGTSLRLLRDNPSLSRPAYVEADLQTIFQEQLYADFAALWLLGHATRLQPVAGDLSKSILDLWRKQANEEGERALGELRDGVTEALLALGNGFLENRANEGLRKAITDGSLTAESYFQELLRLVYRLLFLFAAEERHLLHSPTATNQQRELYRDGYALALLRDRAQRRRHYDRHADLWSGLLLVFCGLADGQTNLGLPALGGLFAFEQCPRLDRAILSNARLLEAILALAYFRTEAGLTLINYRDMGAEELGSVYESLLELHPLLSVDVTPWSFKLLGVDTSEPRKGSARRLTGSYYTPTLLVNELIKSALEPVMTDALRKKPSDPRQALLNLKVLDPACGSGHFLLAAARRIAVEIARASAGPDTPDEATRQHALREVVQHCIYGVDQNPLAVELCKAALWMETVDPGRPLTFLDPHIQCGDSLIGILDPTIMLDGIPSEAYQPLVGDDIRVCRDLKRRNYESAAAIQGNLFDQASLVAVAEESAIVDAMPEGSLEEIAAKQKSWNAVRTDADRQREKRRADLFVAAFLAPKSPESSSCVPITQDLKRLDLGMPMRTGVEAFVDLLAQRHHFFHWHVSFPEVFAKGGFDCVLGNPPWEQTELKEKEWFSGLRESIANAPTAADRKRMIEALEKEDPKLYNSFISSLHRHEGVSHFLANSGRYPLCGRGRINTYAVFAEAMRSILNPDGRLGCVLPSGIATDDTTKLFFQDIMTKKSLISLYDFENKGIFPGVHGSYRFCLFTVGGSRSVVEAAEFIFFAHSTEDLYDADRRFRLSAQEIALINPNTRTCPVFRSRRDAELTKVISRLVPPLLKEGAPPENPWSIRIRRIFNMGLRDVSASARTIAQLTAANPGQTQPGVKDNYVPMLEGKMFDAFNHRAAGVVFHASNIQRGAQPIESSTAQLADPDYSPASLYWFPRARLDGTDPSRFRDRWILGFKDVTAVTNERSMIAAILPFVATNFSVRVVQFLGNIEGSQAALFLGCLNSFVFDYLIRQRLGGLHISDYIIYQVPFVPPTAYSQQCPWDLRASIGNWLVSRILELTYTAWDLERFAQDCGWTGPPFIWDEQRRFWLRCELDAAYFHLYLHTSNEEWTRDTTESAEDLVALRRSFATPRDAVEYIMDTFPIVKRRDEQKWNKYRTKAAILQIFDAIDASAKAGRPYESCTNPPPADPTGCHPRRTVAGDLVGSK